MSDIFYYTIYKILKFIVSYTPQFLQMLFFRVLSWLFYKFDTKHTAIMRANLKHCFDQNTPEQNEQIIRSTYMNFALFGADFLKNQESTKEKILNKVKFINPDLLQNAIDSKRRIIIQTAHYGNWELACLALAAKFGSGSIVARNLDSKVMNKILSKNRTQFDIKIIDKMGGARDVALALKSRRILGILVDQNTSKDEGIEVLFFNKKVLHTPAASIFAQKFDALIIPFFVHKNQDGINELEFYEPIDMKKLPQDNAIAIATQMQADITEKIIRQKPDEYFWFHKRFKHFDEEIYRC